MTPRTRPLSTARGNNARAAGHQWILLALLVTSVCINYIDRGNLSVAAELIGKELAIGPKQLGLLLSAFFWTYAAMQIPCGWLIDRYNVFWIYGGAFLLWSAATAATGLAHTFTAFLLLRTMLGFAESVAYPSYSKILASGFSEHQRGLANGMIDAGSKTGPALGLLIGGTMVAQFGWRMMFFAIGALSLLWLVPWVFAVPRRPVEPPGEVPVITEPAPSLAEIFSKRSAWATILGLMCSNYAWYFLLTWLPSYLVRARHYSMERMATLGSIPFWTVAGSAVASGWIADRWIAHGGSPTLVRKTFTVTGLTLATLLVPAAFVQSATLSLILLTAACLAFGLFTANLFAVTQTLAGPAAAGKWTGIQNGFGNISGIVAPYVTGWIIAETGSFLYAFVAVGVILLLGAFCYLVVLQEVKPVQWSTAASRAADAAARIR
jgi:MFS transporter, ACS family, D-galactonate transporter